MTSVELTRRLEAAKLIILGGDVDLYKNEYSAVKLELFNSCKTIQMMIRSVRDSR